METNHYFSNDEIEYVILIVETLNHVETIDEIKKVIDSNKIKTIREKILAIITKYNFNEVLKIFEKEFETTANSMDKMKHDKMKNDKMKNDNIEIVVGGSPIFINPTSNSKAIKNLLTNIFNLFQYNIGNLGIVQGTALTFIEVMFLLIFMQMLLNILDSHIVEGRLNISVDNLITRNNAINYIIQKLIKLFQFTRSLTDQSTSTVMVTSEPVTATAIGSPVTAINARPFERATVMQEDAIYSSSDDYDHHYEAYLQRQIRELSGRRTNIILDVLGHTRRRNRLLAEYRSELDVIERAALLEPIDLIEVEAVAEPVVALSVIIIGTMPMRNETRSILTMFTEYCFDILYSFREADFPSLGTIAGGFKKKRKSKSKRRTLRRNKHNKNKRRRTYKRK